jgi:hypothetical protein
LKGLGDIFRGAFLRALSNFWLFALTGDKEKHANEDVSPPKPFPLVFGNVYCKNK